MKHLGYNAFYFDHIFFTQLVDHLLILLISFASSSEKTGTAFDLVSIGSDDVS